MYHLGEQFVLNSVGTSNMVSNGPDIISNKNSVSSNILQKGKYYEYIEWFYFEKLKKTEKREISH